MTGYKTIVRVFGIGTSTPVAGNTVTPPAVQQPAAPEAIWAERRKIVRAIPAPVAEELSSESGWAAFESAMQEPTPLAGD